MASISKVCLKVYIVHGMRRQAREQNEGHFMYSKLIVKRHAMYSSYSPLSLERLEGNYCYTQGLFHAQ